MRSWRLCGRGGSPVESGCSFLKRILPTAVGAPHAVALNSCTAALHLAVEALGLKAGQGVLVPTMTFAATAEVVRYLGAIPVLVDCDPVTGNMDLDDASRKFAEYGAKGKGKRGTGIESQMSAVVCR